MIMNLLSRLRTAIRDWADSYRWRLTLWIIGFGLIIVAVSVSRCAYQSGYRDAAGSIGTQNQNSTPSTTNVQNKKTLATERNTTEDRPAKDEDGNPVIYFGSGRLDWGVELHAWKTQGEAENHAVRTDFHGTEAAFPAHDPEKFYCKLEVTSAEVIYSRYGEEKEKISLEIEKTDDLWCITPYVSIAHSDWARYELTIEGETYYLVLVPNKT